MSRPIATHADGSNCYTKSCSRRHATSHISNDILQQINTLKHGETKPVKPTKFFNQDVVIDFKNLNDEADQFYGHGQCFLLALALHEQTGHPLVVWDEPASNDFLWRGHAALQIGENKYLDVNGVLTEEQIAAKFDQPLTKQRLDTHADAVKHCVIWDFFVDKPWQPVGEEAQKATQQYAKLVLKHRTN